MCTKTPGSDPIYKRLYAFREMVADLLRSIFPDDALGADYGSLERLPAEYVGDDYRHRRGDSVWRLRARAAEGRGGWLHVLVLLEYLCCKWLAGRPPLLAMLPVFVSRMCRSGRSRKRKA